jgi:hypothetical protein
MIGSQLLQGFLDWQAKQAAGTITSEDIDAKLAEMQMGSRADLVEAIATRRASDAGG